MQRAGAYSLLHMVVQHRKALAALRPAAGCAKVYEAYGSNWQTLSAHLQPSDGGVFSCLSTMASAAPARSVAWELARIYEFASSIRDATR